MRSSSRVMKLIATPLRPKRPPRPILKEKAEIKHKLNFFLYFMGLSSFCLTYECNFPYLLVGRSWWPMIPAGHQYLLPIMTENRWFISYTPYSKFHTPYLISHTGHLPFHMQYDAIVFCSYENLSQVSERFICIVCSSYPIAETNRQSQLQ